MRRTRRSQRSWIKHFQTQHQQHAAIRNVGIQADRRLHDSLPDLGRARRAGGMPGGRTGYPFQEEGQEQSKERNQEQPQQEGEERGKFYRLTLLLISKRILSGTSFHTRRLHVLQQYRSLC